MTAEELLKEIQGIFESEKWNKFQLSEYNLSKFQSLEENVKSISELGIVDQVRLECEDVLNKNEFNFSALFILGLMNFQSDKILDATAQFQKLVNNFKKKEKPSIVEYLCKKMLEFGDDIFALKNLIPVVRISAKPHELEDLQERLVTLDPSDSETLMQLAAIKEKNEKKNEAIRYYLQALNNYIKNKSRKNVEEIWAKIILIDPEYMEHLLPLEESIQGIFEKDFALHLLQMLSTPLFGSAKWDMLIALFKKIIAYKPDDKDARNRLIELYSRKYETHTQLSQFIIYSGLKQWWEDVHAAIDKFEKIIRFDVGGYVNHQSWGAGRIIQIQDHSIFVDFMKDANHKMTFEMALTSLQILNAEHIKIYKRYRMDELQKMLKNDPVNLVGLVVKQAEKQTTTADVIKSELTDGLVEVEDWNRWWNKIKGDMKKDGHFEFADVKTVTYVEEPSSYEEKMIRAFKEAPDFSSKMAIVSDLLDHEKSDKIDKDLYSPMMDFFQGTLKSNRTEESLASYVLLTRFARYFPAVGKAISSFDMRKTCGKLDSLSAFFNGLENSENKRVFIALVEEKFKDWDEMFLKLVYSRYSASHNLLIERISKKLGEEKVKEFVGNVIENYKDYPDLFYWLGKNIISGNKDFARYCDNVFKVFVNLLYLVSLLGRKIRSGENVDENTKLQKNVIGLLFGKQDACLIDYVVKEKKSGNAHVDTLIDVVSDNIYITDKYKKTLLDAVRNLERIIIA